MYLVDTDVISEARKGAAANSGVRHFFADAQRLDWQLYMSAITLGELRQGVERIRRRGDREQAATLERWLGRVVKEFGDCIVPFDADCAQIWGRLRAPNPENPLDKQIAATALIHQLTVVTRNLSHYESCGVEVANPFA